MISTVIFDFGGVLLDWNPKYLYDKYFAIEENARLFRETSVLQIESPAEMADWFLENICRYEWNVEMDGGKPLAQGTAERIALFPQWEDAIRQYYSNWIEMFKGVMPGMYDEIVRIKAKGFRIYGLSNWSAETFMRYARNLPIFSSFDGIVLSGLEKVVKPDRRIFDIILSRYSINPQESVFVDDNQANIDAAALLGIKGYKFTSPSDFKENFYKQFNL